MTKTPASPQEELPILSTHEGSGHGSNDEEEDEEEEVVLMAIMRPARSIGRTKPELHFEDSV